jgi:hypothetical protein
VGFPFFKTIYTQEAVLARLQTSIRECFDWIMTRPGIRSVELEVALKTGTNVLPHTLGSVPKGYYVVKSNADVRVWNTTAPTIEKITIQASGDASVTLIVY